MIGKDEDDAKKQVPLTFGVCDCELIIVDDDDDDDDEDNRRWR